MAVTKIMLQRQIQMAPYVYYKVGVEVEIDIQERGNFFDAYGEACSALNDLIKRETEWYVAEGCYNAVEKLKNAKG